MLCCAGNPADAGSGFDGFGYQDGFGSGGGGGDGGVFGRQKSMRDALDEINAVDKTNNSPEESNGFVETAKNITKNLIAKAIDVFTLSNPATALANTASQITTNKTIGAYITNTVFDALSKGFTPEAAEVKGAAAAADFVGRSNPDDFGGDAGREAVASAFTGMADNTANISAESLPTVDQNGIPSTIPADISPGLNQFVTDSNNITTDYNARADRLWNDYLDFEDVFFNKNENIQNEYKSNISNLPSLNLKLPATMGGSTLPMAPKVHSAMFSDQANTKANLIGNQANTALGGMASRNALNNNMFNVNQTGLTNSLLPTQTALDLYKMERAGELGIANTQAGKADSPSTLETWAPVVGSLLQTNDSGKSNLSSAWDFVSGLWD